MLRIPGVKPSPRENPEQLARLFVEWHWGTQPTMLKRIVDSRLPARLVECGRLVQLEIETPDSTNPRGFTVQALTIPKNEQEKNHIAFDPDHPNHRLYIILDDKTRQQTRKIFESSPYALTPLRFWAKLASGRHARGQGGRVDVSDYPDIMVKPLGVLRTGGYATNKLPDGPSWYKHMMGEESGIRPMLTITKDGMLWVAGGDYTSPSPGITN